MEGFPNLFYTPSVWFPLNFLMRICIRCGETLSELRCNSTMPHFYLQTWNSISAGNWIGLTQFPLDKSTRVIYLFFPFFLSLFFVCLVLFFVFSILGVYFGFWGVFLWYFYCCLFAWFCFCFFVFVGWLLFFVGFFVCVGFVVVRVLLLVLLLLFCFSLFIFFSFLQGHRELVAD